MISEVEFESAPSQKYMACYRTLRNAVDRRYDVAGFRLHELIWQCLLNHGHVPEEKLGQFLPYVPQPTIDFLERLTTQMMFGITVFYLIEGSHP